MPISEPRPGVFRGRADNKWAWYVVDPRAEGGVDLVATQWQALFDKSNSSQAKRVLERLFGWLVFLGVLAVTLVLASLASQALGGGGGTAAAAIIGIVGLVGALIAAVLSREKLFPSTLAATLQDNRVLPLDAEVVEWASPLTAHEELWQLQSAIMWADQARNAWEYWDVYFDDDSFGDKPTQIIQHVVGPALEAELATRVATLSATAGRVNFTLPARMTGLLSTRRADS